MDKSGIEVYKRLSVCGHKSARECELTQALSKTLAALEQAQAERDRMREVLNKYANPDNWARSTDDPDFPDLDLWNPNCVNDLGYSGYDIARRDLGQSTTETPFPE